MYAIKRMLFNQKAASSSKPPYCDAMKGYPSIASQGSLNPKIYYLNTCLKSNLFFSYLSDKISLQLCTMLIARTFCQKLVLAINTRILYKNTCASAERWFIMG